MIVFWAVDEELDGFAECLQAAVFETDGETVRSNTARCDGANCLEDLAESGRGVEEESGVVIEYVSGFEVYPAVDSEEGERCEL